MTVVRRIQMRWRARKGLKRLLEARGTVLEGQQPHGGQYVGPAIAGPCTGSESHGGQYVGTAIAGPSYWVATQ
jgi:hypothetical protein